MFWYFFVLNALLDFSSVVLLRNVGEITRLFMGAVMVALYYSETASGEALSLTAIRMENQ